MNEFEIFKVFLEEKIAEIKKEIQNNKDALVRKNTMTEVLKEFPKPEDLIYIDVSVLNILDEENIRNIKDTIMKARFLLEECKDLDLSSQPQYKQVIESLNEIHNLFTLISNDKLQDNDLLENDLKSSLKLDSSFDKEGFKEPFFDFDKISSLLDASAISENGKYNILTSLLKRNVKFYNTLTIKPKEVKEEIKKEIVEEFDKQIESSEPIKTTKIEDSVVEEIIENNSFDLANLIEKEVLSIYYDAKEIILENELEARRLEIDYASKKELYGLVKTYEQCGADNLSIVQIRKILLYKIYEQLKDIDDAIKLLEEYEIDKGVIDEISYNIEQLKPLLIDYDKHVLIEMSDSPEDYQELIFSNNVEKEFNSNTLRESFNRHQIISALSDLRKGKFEKTSTFPDKFFAKKKGGPGGRGGIRVVYTRLSNDLVLIMHISPRQAKYDTHFKNIYENNKTFINNLRNESKDSTKRQKLLEINADFKEEIYKMIDEKGMEMGGKKYE